MNKIFVPSPNYDERNSKIEFIILHYTGMKSGKEAIERLCKPGAKVSAHYVIEEDGKVFNLVDESKTAWHAGISYWRGKENLNPCSIGIEIVNPGHEFGYRQFSKAQYDSIIPLCQQIKNKYQIPNINIIGHSDIAPDRKQDPGELFDWSLLAANGIGLFANSEISGSVGDLTNLGYREHNISAITAFQRHWRQSKIDGIMDSECNSILASLLKQI